MAQRCADIAIDTAVLRGVWLIALLMMWLVLAWRPGGAGTGGAAVGIAAALLVLWLGLTLAWLTLRLSVGAERRIWWRLWLWLARLNLLAPTVLAGLLPINDGPAWPCLAMVAVCVAALPMQPGLGRIASLGLWSPAVAGLGSGAEPRVLVFSIVAGGLGWLACGMAGRRWHDEVRQRIDMADRFCQVTAERNAAQRADEDKRRFVAAASHDLRQPMHALGLFAATLERHLQGTADDLLARKMVCSVDALDRSFSALLDLSRLDAGAVQPQVQRFPIRDLFRRLHMQFAGQADETGLGLRFSAGGKAVNSDPQLLERVLSNLIQNALRYTRTGGVVVVARSGANQIKLEVWDSGCGIAEADLTRVFDEFYRVPGGARQSTQGLGMGLAIVKRLLSLLGHSFEVSSQVGRGTMFRIGISTCSMAEVDDATAAAETIPMPFLQTCCVLLVDDEAPIREGLHMLLTEWGFEPVAVADLASAHAAAVTLGRRLDLVISDLHLHNGEDGLAVIERVREACGRQVPAILVTGDTRPAEIRRASASGHRVLFKPVQPSKLFSVLRSMV